MARVYAQQGAARTGITTADTAVPSAPESASGVPVTPQPVGVWGTAGARTLQIFVQAPSTSTGNTTLNIYAWSRALNAWVSMGQAVVAAAAVGDLGPGTRLYGSAVVTNWGSDFVAVMVATLATNGGSGLGTSVAVTCNTEDR